MRAAAHRAGRLGDQPSVQLERPGAGDPQQHLTASIRIIGSRRVAVATNKRALKRRRGGGRMAYASPRRKPYLDEIDVNSAIVALAQRIVESHRFLCLC
jgi:hypothetical protein